MNDSYADRLMMNRQYRGYIIASYSREFNVCEGAYRSGKSTFNALAFALYLERSRDELHLVIATTESLAKSVVEDGNGFGLRYYFAGRYRSGKYKDCPAGFVDTPSGKKIILYIGGAKQNDFARFRGLSIGGVLMTEANLLHQNTFDEAMGRILMAKDPKVFMDMNPDNPNHPIYKWLDGVQKKGLCNYLHTTIDDNPAMTPSRMAEIKSQFDPESVYYRRFILGERVVAENLIYNVPDKDIFSDFNPGSYGSWICVIDPGKSVSATAFIAAAMDFGTGRIDIFKEYRHRNADNPYGIQKYSHDYARDFADFVSDASEEMQSYPNLVIIDSFANDDAYRYVCQELERRGIPTQVKFPIDSEGKMGKDPIELRIQRDSSLLWRGKLRFRDICESTISDFKTVQYDPKKLMQGKEELLETFNSSDAHWDNLFAVDYAVAYYKNALCSLGE
jgi:PBSX family phage terminase large subunit